MNDTSERPVTVSRQTAQATQRPLGRTRCDSPNLPQLHDTRLEPLCGHSSH
jgi:hypothetical protein